MVNVDMLGLLAQSVVSIRARAAAMPQTGQKKIYLSGKMG